jgi:tight adherence protein B
VDGPGRPDDWAGSLNSVDPLAVAVSLALAAGLLARSSGRATVRTARARVVGEVRPPTAGRRWPSSGGRATSIIHSGARAAAVALVTWLAWWLGGPVTAAVGGIAAIVGLRMAARRGHVPDARALDQQVGQFAEGVASAVRGGLSISQAVEFASSEAEPPMTAFVEEFQHAREAGVPLRAALDDLSDRVGTDEIRLLALVLGVHHRSGGNVAMALDDVAATIRHRLKLRRELRALTAQGRISGLVLGVLPIGFFLVMALTSRSQLEPVLRSLPGMVMVSVGFLLEGLAFLWIRQLLRVDA